MIKLQNLLPHPIKEQFQGLSQIWMCDVHFEKGLKYLITAPSGKGKSTFISILYGLRNDYDGTVYWRDSNIRQFSRNQWAALRARHLSLTFQGMHLFPNLTAWENLRVKALLTHNTDSKKLVEMAGLLGISHLLKKKVKFLSFGERQRVSLIRSLIQPFDFLLLDEPFSNLDEKNASIAAQLIAQEVDKRQAGLIVADLGLNTHFNFDHTLTL